jgi:hypothetical protein
MIEEERKTGRASLEARRSRMAIQSMAIKCARVSKRSCSGHNGRNGKRYGRQTGEIAVDYLATSG